MREYYGYFYSSLFSIIVAYYSRHIVAILHAWVLHKLLYIYIYICHLQEHKAQEDSKPFKRNFYDDLQVQIGKQVYG